MLIEPFAFAYAPEPVPPIRVRPGPATGLPPGQITHTYKYPPVLPDVQPVGFTSPSGVAVPFTMLVDTPLLDVSEGDPLEPDT